MERTSNLNFFDSYFSYFGKLKYFEVTQSRMQATNFVINYHVVVNHPCSNWCEQNLNWNDQVVTGRTEEDRTGLDRIGQNKAAFILQIHHSNSFEYITMIKRKAPIKILSRVANIQFISTEALVIDISSWKIKKYRKTNRALLTVSICTDLVLFNHLHLETNR
jgi:hypothetical protein